MGSSASPSQFLSLSKEIPTIFNLFGHGYQSNDALIRMTWQWRLLSKANEEWEYSQGRKVKILGEENFFHYLIRQSTTETPLRFERVRIFLVEILWYVFILFQLKISPLYIGTKSHLTAWDELILKENCPFTFHWIADEKYMLI